MLLVPSGVVQVGERTESGQYRSAGIEHLDLQRVKRGGSGGLSGIDMQPESQVRRGGSRRNCDRLGSSICVSGSVTILPCVPRSAVWRLSGGVVDDSSSQRPGRSGGAVLESRIANELRGCSGANGQADSGGMRQGTRRPGNCDGACTGGSSTAGRKRHNTR